VEWAAALPYANGKVGMFGASYVGATQLLAAIGRPPHLAGVFPVITASNYHEGWTYQGGAFELGFNVSWGAGLALDTMRRQAEENVNVQDWVKNRSIRNLSLLRLHPGQDATPYFREWIDHPSYDAYWKEISIEERHDQFPVPAYHVAGWYDIFLGGSLRNYVGIKARTANETAKHGQRLIVGPWCHAPLGSKVGDLDFVPPQRWRCSPKN